MEGTGINLIVIQEIRRLAQKYQIDQVILFGSRARGDYKKVSDIDLAVRGGDFDRFALDVDEETSTLLKYDFVNLDGRVQEELRTSIEQEGRILYEICFEQSWKMMKELLESHGYEGAATGSPKFIIKINNIFTSYSAI